MEISPPRKMCQLFDFSRGEDLVAEFSIEKKGKGGSVRCLVRSKAEERYAEELKGGPLFFRCAGKGKRY